MSNGVPRVDGSASRGYPVTKRVFLGPRGFAALKTNVNYDEWSKKPYVNVEITTGDTIIYLYDRKELIKLVKYIQAALDVDLTGEK